MTNPYGDQVGGGHYKDLPIGPTEFAMANDLNACQFQAVKYLIRKKGALADRLEDLNKAIHAIRMYQHEIEKKGV